MTDNGERIAALETQMETLLSRLDAIETDTKEIKATLTQQRGFIAGMLTILAPLWGFAIFVANKLWDTFSGNWS
jgi:hypothetical protein